MAAEEKRILISGGGIAGPVLGFLLHRVGWKVTIIERAQMLRATGQQIDLSGAGLTVIRRMGLDAAIRKEIIHIDGLRFVDEKDKVWAEFAQQNTQDAFVREYEILRGDLASIFYDATEKDLEWIIGDYITNIEEDEKGATVSFNKTQDRRFDVVVAADGQNSKTRGLLWHDDEVEIRHLGLYGALFTIPWAPSDGSWDRWYSDTRGRCYTLRPQKSRKKTGAYFLKTEPSRCDAKLNSLLVEKQQDIIRDLFKDGRWSETKRMLEGMDRADDTYTLEAVQVHCRTLTKGRVALLGDAGSAPSPLTGQGTSMAVIGAYVLAGCLSQHDDAHEALAHYEKDVRPFVDKLQKLIPGVPQVANPQTTYGVWFLYRLLWIVSLMIKSGLTDVLTAVSNRFRILLRKREITLPSYPRLEAVLPEPDAA